MLEVRLTGFLEGFDGFSDEVQKLTRFLFAQVLDNQDIIGDEMLLQFFDDGFAFGGCGQGLCAFIAKPLFLGDISA